MDVLSHALWGYVSVRWRGPKTARWGALFGAAPDLLFGAGWMGRRLFQHGWAGLSSGGGEDPTVWRRGGPPLPQEWVDAYQDFYVYTHSLVLLGAAALAWYLATRRPPWLLLPCAVHILMDIPTHERYLTQFLFPLSDVAMAGYSWGHPPILLGNWLALGLVYGWLGWRYLQRRITMMNTNP